MRVSFYTSDNQYLFSEDFSFNPTGILVTYQRSTYEVTSIVYDADDFGQLKAFLSSKQGEPKKQDPIIPWTEYIKPTPEEYQYIQSLKGQKLFAVKWVKETYNVGLREAKDYIDDIF